MSSLLQNALQRVTLEQRPLQIPKSPRLNRGNEEGSDNEEIDVKTDVFGTPSRPASRIGSRSTSPTRSSSSKRRDKEADAESLDPIRRLGTTLAAKVFRQLEIADLKRCQRVCKRWKRSQTLNWCWYCAFQQRAFVDTVLPEKPVWTRRDSKQDWIVKYKSAYRKDDLEYAYAEDADEDRARQEGWRTPREEQEERWREENTEEVFDKNQMRQYYKGLKNSKAKTKGSGTRSPGNLRDFSSAGENYE